MNTEKMTVHRALAELKTLDSRIHKAIQSAKYCAAVRHNDGKIEGVTVEEYKRKIKSDFQSVKSMINRRNAMKRAVVLSNCKLRSPTAAGAVASGHCAARRPGLK